GLLPPTVVGLSADGALVHLFGRPPGLPLDNYLLDGQTGQVLRKLGFAFNRDRSVLSADGRWLAGVVNDTPEFRRFFAVIADARTGTVLVRTPIDGDMNDLQRVAFAADGKAFVLHHRGNREVTAYELRGAVPGVGPEVRVPAPLGPIPERVRPGTPVVQAPPVQPRDPGLVPVPNGLPVPPLKPRWTVAT